MNIFKKLAWTALATLVIWGLSSCRGQVSNSNTFNDPVDHVNPYMGNISHLLVPTYATIHLPNAMMRIIPNRADHTNELIDGLPMLLTSHRGAMAFCLNPLNELPDSLPLVKSYSYDNEVAKPYHYEVLLDEEQIKVNFAPAYQSAIYQLQYEQDSSKRHLIVSTYKGNLTAEGNSVSGHEYLQDSIKVYMYMQSDQVPQAIGIRSANGSYVNGKQDSCSGSALILSYGANKKAVNLRYGVSFISVEQAKKNLQREIQAYNVNVVSKMGRNEWNKALSKIEIEGASKEQLQVFYTSLYRYYERMVCISEDGRYYSADRDSVYNDEGIPFYTDDWIWDTYRAAHPLRILINSEKESHMISSFIRMAEQSKEGWLPTFPEVTGDSHRMNGNHGIAVLADAFAKGLTDFDLHKAYEYARKVMEEKTYAPWRRMPKGDLDHFFDNEGFYPALHPDEDETDPTITRWEKRQAVAVTLAASYDYWCLSKLAQYAHKEDEAKEFLRRSYDYRNLFNSETAFFHPKDKKGNFIQPFDYRIAGGQGARDYYDENNAYTYRWDVQHNIPDLIALMDGQGSFIKNLQETFRTPLGMSKFSFYYRMPDQTANVGQFTMANEPSLHIPYLYAHAGAPWLTQKAIRTLVNDWFRNDLMGVPGDEDGGGLSSFVVFSMMGFYPVTPGLPIYTIGSPFFSKVTIDMGHGNRLEVIAKDVSAENKYIQSAVLNGKTLNNAWFKHSDIAQGGVLELKMGPKPAKSWGINPIPAGAAALPLAKQ